MVAGRVAGLAFATGPVRTGVRLNANEFFQNLLLCAGVGLAPIVVEHRV